MRKHLCLATMILFMFFIGCDRTTTVATLATDVNTPDDVELMAVDYDAAVAGFSAQFSDILVNPYSFSLSFDILVSTPEEEDEPAFYHLIIQSRKEGSASAAIQEDFTLYSFNTARRFTFDIAAIDDSVYDVTVVRSTGMYSEKSEYSAPGAGFAFRIPADPSRPRLEAIAIVIGSAEPMPMIADRWTQHLAFGISDADHFLDSIRVVVTTSATRQVWVDRTIEITDLDREDSRVVLDIACDNLSDNQVYKIVLYGSGSAGEHSLTDLILYEGTIDID